MFLKAEQLAALSVDQISSLSDDQLASFNQGQLTRMPAATLQVQFSSDGFPVRW